MLYLPVGSHCGGSSEPAWVASSWVLTPPTQSYLTHPSDCRNLLLTERMLLQQAPEGRVLPGRSLLKVSLVSSVKGWPRPSCSPAPVSRNSCNPPRSQMWRPETKKMWLQGDERVVVFFGPVWFYLLVSKLQGTRLPSGAAREKILLLFVDTGSKWEQRVKSSGALHSPSQRSWLWLVERGHPVRKEKQWLAEAEKLSFNQELLYFSPGQDRGVNSESQNLWQNHCMHCLTTKALQIRCALRKNAEWKV